MIKLGRGSLLITGGPGRGNGRENCRGRLRLLVGPTRPDPARHGRRLPGNDDRGLADAWAERRAMRLLRGEPLPCRELRVGIAAARTHR